jgi:hypothetical protein
MLSRRLTAPTADSQHGSMDSERGAPDLLSDAPDGPDAVSFRVPLTRHTWGSSTRCVRSVRSVRTGTCCAGPERKGVNRKKRRTRRMCRRPEPLPRIGAEDYGCSMGRRPVRRLVSQQPAHGGTHRSHSTIVRVGRVPLNWECSDYVGPSRHCGADRGPGRGYPRPTAPLTGASAVGPVARPGSPFLLRKSAGTPPAGGWVDALMR